jgi:ankyrin repeat protein
MQNCSGWTALHMAAFVGNQAVVRLLLAQRGVDLSVCDGEGATPLHAAVGAGHLECVRMLIAKGANVNARAESGDTPLHFAARMGHAAIAAMLLKVGADRGQTNMAGIACAGMPGFAAYVARAEREKAEASGDPDLPLSVDIGPNVPEARSHHFIVDEKAVEAVANTWVTFVLRTAPPRLGLRFVTRCSSSFNTKVKR